MVKCQCAFTIIQQAAAFFVVFYQKHHTKTLAAFQRYFETGIFTMDWLILYKIFWNNFPVLYKSMICSKELFRELFVMSRRSDTYILLL